METESSLAVPKETRRAALDGLLQLPTSRRMVEGLGLAFEALGLAPAALRPEDAAAMVSAWQRGLTVVLELSPLNPSDPAVERLVMRELLSGRWHRVTADWARRGVEFRDFARAISAARAVVQRELQDRLMRLSRLGDMAHTVRSTVDLQPVLQSIVDKVCESGPWTMAAIGIVEETQGVLRVPAQHGFA